MGAVPILDAPAGRGAPMLASSDERLVARVRGGDRIAFEAVYDRYHRQLLAFCRHMLGSREEAEDALQHVFMSAYRQLLADERAVQLKPWLYAIARNRCLSSLRARREVVAFEDAPEPATEGLAVASEVQHREDLRAMLNDLSQLPTEQRAALLLAELGDLGHDEIALSLDVQKDKVKSLVFQARASLMAARQARDADCGDIQQQLATLQGSALRRATIRRHVDGCPPCAAFQVEVRRQRAAIAAVLPVIPTFALKHNVLSSAFAAAPTTAISASATALTSASAGGNVTVASTAGAGISGAVGASGLALKILAVVAVAGGAGGGIAAISDVAPRVSDKAPAALTSSPSQPAERRGSTDAASEPSALPKSAPNARAQSPASRSASDSPAQPGVELRHGGDADGTNPAPGELTSNRAPAPQSGTASPGNPTSIVSQPAESNTYSGSDPTAADQNRTDTPVQSYPGVATPTQPSGNQAPAASSEPAGDAGSPPAAAADPTSSTTPAGDTTTTTQAPDTAQQSPTAAPVPTDPAAWP